MTGSVFDTAAVLVVLAALFGYFNHRVLKLPFAIGLTASSFMASLGVLALDALVPSWGLDDALRHAVLSVNFPETLLHGMLSFLLFAGALHVNMDELMEKLRAIITLATLGVLISTVLIGFASYGLLQLLHIPVALPWCLVFGALISPTDPVAVLGIMRAAGASRGHEVKIVGESLFNDGVGVVVFTLLLAAARAGSGHGEAGAHGIAWIALVEVGGGLVLGLVAGYIAYRAMRTLDEPNLEILISVALVMGVSLAAFRLHASAPLACVVAGLFIGNRGRRLAMSERTRTALDLVWEFLDEGLNAVLFLMVGLEVVVAVRPDATSVAAGALMIPIALAARAISVAVPVFVLGRFEAFTHGVVRVLTWGGLKGGISVALALSLPPFEGREVVLTMTYMVVLFSIIVQGLSVSRVVKMVRAGAGGREL